MTEEDDIEGLAAEYVLGALDPAERAEVAARRKTDALLDAAISAWERRLAPLSDREPGVAPPLGLFERVLARISGGEAGAARSADIVPLLNRPARRRRLAVTLSAIAACVAVAVGWYNHMHVGPQGPEHHASMDCGRLYKDFWEKFDRNTVARISADQLAGVSRMALRAHDACQAGDDQDAKALFDKLRRMQF
jgi:hypothetical protein